MSDFDVFRAEQMLDPEFRDYCRHMQVYEDIAKAIMDGRIFHKLTQTELAKRCGMNQADISKFENCDQLPTLKTLSRIAEAMGYTVRVVFEPFSAEEDPLK